MKFGAFAAAALAAVLGVALWLSPVKAATASPARHVKSTCMTIDLQVKPLVGMPADDQYTMCGTGMPVQSWRCPVTSIGVLPGTRLNCVKG